MKRRFMHVRMWRLSAIFIVVGVLTAVAMVVFPGEKATILVLAIAVLSFNLIFVGRRIDLHLGGMEAGRDIKVRVSENLHIEEGAHVGSVTGVEKAGLRPPEPWPDDSDGK
jgi:hypothetical protein